MKFDRAGAIAARRLALALVRGGGAPEATVELLWRLGDREARTASFSGPLGEQIDPAPWLSGIDLTLRDAGNRWTPLVRGQMPRLAITGHFGDGQPWDS